MAWLYVPGLEGSNSALVSHSLNTAASVTSRGKPIPRPSLSRAWRRASWMKRLSGMTLRPSTAARGVALWISSLRASLVSPGVAPGSDVAPATNGGCGHPSLGSFARLDRDTCSWRTCHVSLTGGFPSYLGTWPYSGMMRSGTCSQRRRSVRRTSANGFSSWRTPQVSDAQGGPHRPESTFKIKLSDQVTWPTPTAADGRRTSLTHVRGNPTLLGAVRERETWPTPTKSILYEEDLERARTHGRKLWPTPKATPSGPDYARRNRNGSGGDDLITAVGGKLNPLWVEWLIGWPIGWTGLEPVGMESFHSWLLSHSQAFAAVSRGWTPD